MRYLLLLAFSAILLSACVKQQTQAPSAEDPAASASIVSSNFYASSILSMFSQLGISATPENISAQNSTTTVVYTTFSEINRRKQRGEIVFKISNHSLTSVLLCPSKPCAETTLQEAFDALNSSFPKFLAAKQLLDSYYAEMPPASQNNGKDFLEYDLGFKQMQAEGLVLSYSLLSSNQSAATWRIFLNMSQAHGPSFESKIHCDLAIDYMSDSFSGATACIDNMTSLPNPAWSEKAAKALPLCAASKFDDDFVLKMPDMPGNMLPTVCVILATKNAERLKTATG